MEELTSINPEALIKGINANDVAKEVVKVILITNAVYEILKITKEIVKLCVEFKKS